MGDLKDVKKQLLAKAKGIKITNSISVLFVRHMRVPFLYRPESIVR